MQNTTSPLCAYRAALYQSVLSRARDALYDLCDALATHGSTRPFVELSQAPCFQRRWPSLYEALEDGRIDQAARQRLFVQTRPRPGAGACSGAGAAPALGGGDPPAATAAAAGWTGLCGTSARRPPHPVRAENRPAVPVAPPLQTAPHGLTRVPPSSRPFFPTATPPVGRCPLPTRSLNINSV